MTDASDQSVLQAITEITVITGDFGDSGDPNFAHEKTNTLHPNSLFPFLFVSVY